MSEFWSSIVTAFSWITIADFGNSNFFSSVVGALFGAFAGAYFAQRMVEKYKIREELSKELQNTNAAISIAVGLCNYCLALKKQHLIRFREDFETIREAALKSQEEAKAGKEGVFRFTANLQSLPVPTFPIDTLRAQVFERLSIIGRPLSLVTSILDCTPQLAISIAKRNQLIESYKAKIDPGDPRFANIYFGFPTDDGHVNSDYPDTLRAIFTYNDDIIFFSHLLCTDLVSHATKLAERIKKVTPKAKTKVFKVDWGEAEQQGLIPPEEEYEAWLHGFIEGST